MNRLFPRCRHLVLAACAALATAPVMADTHASGPADLGGRWNVAYYDVGFHSVVRGTAYVDLARRRADITLIDPETFSEHRFTTERLRSDGESLAFDLLGEWPGAEKSPYTLGEAIPVAPGSADFQVRLGDTRTRFPVDPPSRVAELDRVHIELKGNAWHLSGEWHYTADPRSHRSIGDEGRIGGLSLNPEDGSATERGQEWWSRPEPRVLLTIPVDDQSDEVYVHPDGAGRDYRELIVFGIDLPDPEREAIDLRSFDPQIEYRLRRLDPGADSPGGTLTAALTRLERTDPKAHHRLKDAYARREITALLIEARLRTGVEPGLTHFALNGAEGGWLLQFADYVADLAFVRRVAERPEAVIDPDAERDALPAAIAEETPLPLTMEVDGETREVLLLPPPRPRPSEAAIYEPAAMAYYPEQVYVQIVARRTLPFDRIPLRVTVDGMPTAFVRNTGAIEPEVDAPRPRTVPGGQPTPSDDITEVIYATRDPDDPRRYLSPPIALVGPGRPLPASYSPDALFSTYPISDQSTLIALVDHEDAAFTKSAWHFDSASPMARTSVEPAPSDTGASRVSRLLTWNSAVRRAGACYPDLTVTDPERDAVRVVDSFTHYLFNAWAVSKVDFERRNNVLLGDHAAMLLLRDTFVELLDNHLADLQGARLVPRGFYLAMRNWGRDGADALRRPPDLLLTPVSSPDGGKIELRAIFGSEQDIANRFGLTGQAARTWQDNAIREAIDAYVPRVEQTRDTAGNADDCQLQALLDLTGRNFEPVAMQTLPRLLRRSPFTGFWEPDRAARAFVMNLSLLGDSERSEAELVKGDRTLAALEVAGLSLIPLAIKGALAVGGWAVATAAPEIFLSTALTSTTLAALDVADFGYTVANAWSERDAARREFRFAAGSTAILGHERADTARDDLYLAEASAKRDLIAAALGLTAGLDDIYRGFRYAADPAARLGELGSSTRRIVAEPRQWLGSQLRPWPGFTFQRAWKRGQVVYRRLGRNSRALWTTAAHLASGAPRVAPELLTQIGEAVRADLRAERELYQAARQDPARLDALIDSRGLSGADAQRLRDQFQNAPQALESASVDPDSIPTERLDALIRQVADDVAAETTLAALPPQTLVRRSATRVQRVLDDPALYQASLNRTLPPLPPLPATVAGSESLSEARRAALDEMAQSAARLPEAERELLALSTREAAFRAAETVAEIAAEDDQAIAFAHHLAELGKEKPIWARALTDSEYRKVENLYLRTDVHRMAANDPNGFKAALNDPLGPEVLHGEPFRSAQELNHAIKRARQRVTDPVAGVYEAARPSDKKIDGLEFITKREGMSNVDVTIYRGPKKLITFERSLETIGEARASAWRGSEKKLIGLADSDRMLVMGNAEPFVEKAASELASASNKTSGATKNADELPSWLLDVQKPMVPGKGTPLATHANLQAMQLLGIPFGDPTLKVCKLSSVMNQKTALQLHWLRSKYPDKPLAELIKYTHSYQYAESALTQAGFRIKKTDLGEQLTRIRASDKPYGGEVAFGTEGKAAFLERYEFTDVDDRIIGIGHDIYLMLEPISR